MKDETRQEFLEILSHTSRSFSLGILGLEQPLQDQVCLGYLLCRILDTYEDTMSIPTSLRLECLNYSLQLMESLQDTQKIGSLLGEWIAKHNFDSAWTAVQHPDPWEHTLLFQGDRIWREIANLEPEVRSAFQVSITDMITGMRDEIIARQQNGLRTSRSLKETDDYCYYVAGTVGRLLTRLFHIEGALPVSDITSADIEGIGFGKALQLVNILKDFHKDWLEGRCFWPGIELPSGPNTSPPQAAVLEPIFWELKMRFEDYEHLALRYTERLNSDRKDVKFFCAFPLRMATATLTRAVADMSWLRSGGTFKVSRDEVAAILGEFS